MCSVLYTRCVWIWLWGCPPGGDLLSLQGLFPNDFPHLHTGLSTHKQKDHAGNAFSTTVAAAQLLSALVHSRTLEKWGKPFSIPESSAIVPMQPKTKKAHVVVQLSLTCTQALLRVLRATSVHDFRHVVLNTNCIQSCKHDRPPPPSVNNLICSLIVRLV
jgi:hypothetical protein